MRTIVFSSKAPPSTALPETVAHPETAPLATGQSYGPQQGAAERLLADVAASEDGLAHRPCLR